MNARQQILLDYGILSEGEHLVGELCPACQGGSTREGSLSVTRREGSLLWHCHRASCGFSGGEHASGSARGGTATAVPECRGVVGCTIARAAEALDESTVSYLQERYHITTVDISRYGLGWDNESDRLCIPTSDFLGNRTGVVLRALDKRQPKTKTHTEKDALSWFVNHSATIPGLIIVEDQFSAIRASRYLTSVALLGTHLNDQRVAEVRACKLRPVYLALDADAWSTAVRYAVRYRSELRPHLLRLERDLKDLSPEELQEFMNGI